MRKAVAFSLFLFAACASSSRSKAPVPLPEVVIVQTGGVAQAARDVTGPIPVKYAVRVTNKANVPIKLKTIQAQSVGAGAYRLNSTTRPFDRTIAPDSHEDVEIFASAVVDYNTITGANGPTTIRLILNFESDLGPFQDVVVQEVNDRFTGTIP